MQRDRLARIARHRDADEIAGADDAVGGIELDPAGARQIDLHPGMGRAAADIAMGAVAGDEQIARDEARGDAEPPQRLDHEQRVVAAGAGPGLQRVERMLGAVLVPLAVGEGLADAVGHAAENVEGRGRAFGVEKIPRPCRQLAIGIAILRRDELNEVGKFLVVIEKRIEIGRIIRRSARTPRPDCARPSRCLRTTASRARSSKVAIATLLPNTSWIQRSDIGSGTISRLPESTRRSWPSRGRSMMRCSPNATGCA